MKLYFAIALLLLFSACSINHKSPQWLLETPSDPAFYTAIVNEDTTRKNYKDLAREKALRDIAMQISTQIEASIRVSEHESMGIATSEYLSTLEATSSASIRDMQLLDSYKTGTKYYAYYRLNKAEYHAQRKIQCDRALESALDMLQRYDASEADIAQGIPLLLQALESLVDYLDMDLNYSGHQSTINVYNEILSRLRSLAAKLKIEFAQPRMQATARLAMLQYAIGRTSLEDQACPNVPLKAAFQDSKGELRESIVSDHKGDFELAIKRIESPESPQRIKVELDTAVLAKHLSKPAAIKLWQSISFSPAYLNLDVHRPLIYLDYSFIASYQNGLRDVLASKLANLDLALANKLEDAQYLLEVRIFAKKGEHLNNLDYYTSYGDIHLSLKNPKTGANLNYLERLNLKSGGNTREKAERAVEYESVKVINDGMLYRLLYDAILK